jgi:hypothetical protein
MAVSSRTRRIQLNGDDLDIIHQCLVEKREEYSELLEFDDTLDDETVEIYNDDIKKIDRFFNKLYPTR